MQDCSHSDLTYNYIIEDRNTIKLKAYFHCGPLKGKRDADVPVRQMQQQTN